MARHILIIDDNEYLLYLLRSVLEDERYQVSVIGRGEGASERIEENPPDAIILDLKLGEVSGLDVLESLRSHEATATIPVLIYTAAILEAETAAKLVAGNPARYRNVSVLRKPFDVDVLLARVGQLIEAS
jgi:DNA-binding response OmpR family regulator